ncbi:amino-acid N-acetyltransferas-like protein subunit Mak10 [Delitschia confertaspora ATCC 74209]|uniref:Amino-acid N-acetyltransferas-like protein subunit Mak10 n=1 Tax=Delitschia confertaspora ATCC 74209 TaxID=1513339 RepID=A0A9P4JIC1_9PLEO|nr:amino-acid N-acetyltransferas-like protein subunit Mak10 [Delitschia confertaspora ATCC 74209]
MTEPMPPGGSTSGKEGGALTQEQPGVSAASTTLPLRHSLRAAAIDPKLHDITEKFTEACNALKIGQLVKDEYFTLFESIGALEIMDTKMDSGFLQPGETLDEVYDTLAPLLPEEVIGIMDQLLCYEMAWHTGYPLSQTLLTSVYIDKLLWPEPRSVEQAQFYRGYVSEERRPGLLLRVLRAYCLALVKCVDSGIAVITNRDFFEEEDICTHTYNRVLFPQVGADVFVGELEDVIQNVQECAEEYITDDLKKAMLVRLEFRKNFLAALDLECPLDQLNKHWPLMQSNLVAINVTHQLGKPVEGSFSTKIQRRLASTVPPRPIVVLEFKDAFEKLKQLCADCEEATRFTSLPQNPLEYQSFMWAFASRSPPPLTYSRSYLSNLLFHPSSDLSILLQSDLGSLVFPASVVLDPSNWALSPPQNPNLPKDKRFQLAQLINDFTERAGHAYLEFWTALGQNRCRLRRMLCHAILGFDQVQNDAYTIDEGIMALTQEMGSAPENEIMPYPLTTWSYYRKLWMMEKVVFLGFEQDIYLPDEFAAQYHFLSTIASTRSRLLTNVSTHINAKYRRLFAAEGQTLRVATLVETANYVDSLLAESIGVHELSTALAKFWMVVLYLGLLGGKKLARPFSSPELRYELRMKPFWTLQPAEVPPFEEFRRDVWSYGPYDKLTPRFLEDLQNPQAELWMELDEAVKRAKEAWAQVKRFGAKSARAEGVEESWKREIQGVLASCVALGVAVAGIKGQAPKDLGEIRVEIPKVGSGKRYREGWVVGKVCRG